MKNYWELKETSKEYITKMINNNYIYIYIYIKIFDKVLNSIYF